MLMCVCACVFVCMCGQEAIHFTVQPGFSGEGLCCTKLSYLSRWLHHHTGAPACAEQSVAKRRPQPPARCVRVLVFVFVKKGWEKRNIRAVENSKASECVRACMCVCGGDGAVRR